MFKNAVLLPFLNWARKLRYPALFKLTAVLFVGSVLFPDPIPLLDEVVFGLATILLANWKRRKDDPPPLDAGAARH